ncbi:hypothetical protein [Nostoc sp. DSM 114167]|jgi:hypothetical protein
MLHKEVSWFARTFAYSGYQYPAMDFWLKEEDSKTAWNRKRISDR